MQGPRESTRRLLMRTSIQLEATYQLGIVWLRLGVRMAVSLRARRRATEGQSDRRWSAVNMSREQDLSKY